MAKDNLPLSIESMMKTAFEYELRNIIRTEKNPSSEERQVIEEYFQVRIKEMNEHMSQ